MLPNKKGECFGIPPFFVTRSSRCTTARLLRRSRPSADHGLDLQIDTEARTDIGLDALRQGQQL